MIDNYSGRNQLAIRKSDDRVTKEQLVSAIGEVNQATQRLVEMERTKTSLERRARNRASFREKNLLGHIPTFGPHDNFQQYLRHINRLKQRNQWLKDPDMLRQALFESFTEELNDDAEQSD